MQFEVHPQQAGLFRAMSMGMRPEDQIQPRSGDAGPKLAPNGSLTFASGVVVMRDDGSGQDKGSTIAVCEYTEFQMGTVLRTDGRVWVTPYVGDSGRQAHSIIAERLVPVDAPKVKGD